MSKQNLIFVFQRRIPGLGKSRVGLVLREMPTFGAGLKQNVKQFVEVLLVLVRLVARQCGEWRHCRVQVLLGLEWGEELRLLVAAQEENARFGQHKQCVGQRAVEQPGLCNFMLFGF